MGTLFITSRIRYPIQLIKTEYSCNVTPPSTKLSQTSNHSVKWVSMERNLKKQRYTVKLSNPLEKIPKFILERIFIYNKRFKYLNCIPQFCNVRSCCFFELTSHC